MKQYILAIFVVLFSFSCFGKDHSAENMAEFQSEFKGLIEIEDKTLYIQRIVPFEGESKESQSLYNSIKSYISSRVERKQTGKSSNSDVIYDDDAIILTEQTPPFNLAGGWRGRINYVYKLEVKDGRVRLTMFINSYDYGQYSCIVEEFYPFSKRRNKPFVKLAKSFFHAFADYANSTFSSFPEDLRKSSIQESEDDW